MSSASVYRGSPQNRDVKLRAAADEQEKEVSARRRLRARGVRGRGVCVHPRMRPCARACVRGARVLLLRLRARAHVSKCALVPGP